MRSLELFAGTQSFSKGIHRAFPDAQGSAETAFAQTITVDLSTHFNPTHLSDINAWDHTQYPPGYFDIIWASPPCTHYSKAKTQGIRDLDGSDQLVARAFEIIDYYQPKAWVIENVGTGLLVDRMENIRPHLTYYFADYCQYGKPARKRTVFWSNQPLDLHLCPGVGQCLQMEGTRHRSSVGNGKHELRPQGLIKNERFTARNSIPEALIDNVIAQLLLDVP